MDDIAGTVPSKYLHASKMVRGLSWAQISVPVVGVVVTLPGSIYLLVFGGPVIAVPIALGILGLGLGKGLRAGQRAKAAGVWALIHASSYLALALHSPTWDAQSPGEMKVYLLARIVFWLATAAHLSVLLILLTPRRTQQVQPYDGDVYANARPSLWPWLIAALIVLIAIGLNIAVPAKS